MSHGSHSTPELVEQVFDAAKCREQATHLAPRRNDRNTILRGGPLDGCRFPVDRDAKTGATVGLAQQTRLGVVSVTYALDLDGVWRFQELTPIGW